MNPCNELNIIKFLDHELTENQRIEFEQHLDTCAECWELYRQVSGANELLSKVERPQAPKSVYKAYKKELTALFTPQPRWGRMVATFQSLFAAPHPIAARLASAAALILVGIMLGRLSVSSPDIDGPPYQVQYSAAHVEYDAEFIQNYFSKTEFLLLAIKNGNVSQASFNDWRFNKKVAESLLSQKEIIDKANIAQGDDIVTYLDQLEMILLEISNMEPEQISQSFSVLKEIVREADLVQTTRQIQRRVSVNHTQV